MSEDPPQPLTPKGERAQVPARWIDTIRFTLADIVARGEWDDFGLFRILNRISFVCRNHLIFVVVLRQDLKEIISKTKEVRPNIHYQASPLISSLDPEFFDLTFSSLFNEGLVSKTITYSDFLKDHKISIRINAKIVPKYAIQIWGSPVFVIAMELHVQKNKPGVKPPLHLAPVEVSSELGVFLSEVLKPFDGMEGSSKDYPNLSSSRMLFPKKAAEDGLSKLRRVYVLKRGTNDDPCLLTDQERSIILRFFKEVDKLVEVEYERLSLSPILNNKSYATDDYQAFTPNMMFISKLFNSEELRYNHYKYNSQVLISEQQEKDIVDALGRVKRNDYIPFDKGPVDRKFWELAADPQGRRRIVELARRPVPLNVRLFAESVLMSGTTLIKPGIFERGAIGWIDPKASPSERQDALDHLGRLHFLLQLGSPVKPTAARELSLVALPFRCSGGIWMCAVYVRENPAGPIAGVIDQKSFEENTLIYHSLFRETERRLRRRARGRYTDALGKLIAQATIETRIRHGKEAIMALDEAACDSFTKNMRLLTRVYPFDGIELLGPMKPSKFQLFDEIPLRSEPNGYFDRLTMHNFLKEEANIKRLRERVWLASITETDEAYDEA